MENLYDDLENYDDADTANKLKAENSELKHKLGECNKSMEMLQKDFDKLAAEFKVLKTNYSSLLKIARAEIQRKTEMISNLNIQKDMLIISAAQKVPPNKIQQLVKNVQTEAKRKKKNIVGGQKDRPKFIRRECERPASSEASSTPTDTSHKMVDNERVTDNTKTSIKVTQENEARKREVFPDHGGDGNRSPVAVDRRLSALACHQFSKLSSDEEFEDMYSALKPETSRRELERNRKRGRDDTEESNKFYNNTHDRSSNYPDPFRERFNRNKTSRFSNNDRNMNRDKQYNEGDRNMNRDKHYDGNKIDKYDSHYQRYSPERDRRGALERADDRYTQQYNRNRRLVSPPRERNQHRSRERRRSCHDREREDQKDAHRYNYPETQSVKHHIHAEYDEPLNKRPRIDLPFPIPQEDRRLSEKQYFKDMYPSNLRDHTCQSPDFLHEESSNDPIPEIRSTASTVLEDPRVASKKYVKTTEGNKEVLQSANASKIYLQPVNKSLWDVQDVQVPKALRLRPSEIGEEHVDEMDIDKPMSIISMESGEIGSETTDTVTDVSDFQEVNRSKYEYGSRKIESQKMEKKHREEKSPIENTGKVIIGYKSDILEMHDKKKAPIEITSKEIGHKRDVLEKEPKTRSKLVNSNKMNYRRADESTTPPRDDNKASTNTHNDTTQKPSILQRLVNSILDKSPERDSFVKSSKSKERKERKRTSKLKKLDKTEQETSRTVEGRERKETSELKKLNKTEQETSNTVVGRERKETSELNTLDKTEQETSNTVVGRERKETSELKKFDKTEQETSRTVEHTEHKKSLKSEKGYESNVQVFQDFEHRVYSTRHIVEGDLELSDESNHETELKIDEKKIAVKEKQKIRRKSTRDICKEKPVDLEDTARKTRSKKDKDKEEKTTNKLSELFGDSSSLITPEDLKLATRTAHSVPAECCPPASEDAQDGIVESQECVQRLTSKVLNGISETKEKYDGPTIEEDKIKTNVTKDSTNRTHKRHKSSESSLGSDNTHKAPDRQELSEVKKKTVNSTETPSVTEVKLVLSNEKLQQMQNSKITTDTNDALKLNWPVKTNKRLKNKDEKRLSINEPVEESSTKETYNVLETNSNKTLASDNKENAVGNDNSEGNISSEMARIFENTLVSDVNKDIHEKLPLHNSAKDTISSIVVQDVPNLAPVLDEPGLVKTVVISTGTQLLDSNSTQHATTFNALASSTPAKELSIVNNSSDMGPKISHSAHVSVTIERDDTVSLPDIIRINYNRRRRKVLKR